MHWVDWAIMLVPLCLWYWEWLFIPDDMYAELRIFWRPDGSPDAM